MPTASAISTYIEWQAALARYGVTPATTDMFFAVTDALGISLVEPDRLNRALEQLHTGA
jgi:hypothetical protein